MTDSRSPSLQIRIKLASGIAFGPGKAELLERIAATGSISAAARGMRMSYKRAWQLVDEMNRCFRAPLVTAAAGGSRGGGATLTSTGVRALAAYREVQRLADAAAHQEIAGLARLATAKKG
jgi:molybdate transport system regulatory protein